MNYTKYIISYRYIFDPVEYSSSLVEYVDHTQTMSIGYSFYKESCNTFYISHIIIY